MYNTSAFFGRIRLLYLDLHEFARCKLTSDEQRAILGAVLFTLASKRWHCRHVLGGRKDMGVRLTRTASPFFLHPFLRF